MCTLLESFTIDTFAGRVGETFLIRSDDRTSLEAELISATGLGESPEHGRPFSVLFRGPGDVLLPQRIHRMEHAEIGAFEIFLVPIGPDDKGHRYEAVFT